MTTQPPQPVGANTDQTLGLKPFFSWRSRASRASCSLEDVRNSDIFDELAMQDYSSSHRALCKSLKASYPEAYNFIEKKRL